MNPLTKTLELRKNYKIKSREPMRAYQRRISLARDILQLIERNGRESSKQEARRLFLVTVAAGFELYWRDLIRAVIDRKKVTLKEYPKLRNINFTLADIEQIIGNRVTLGELLSCSYTFQNTKVVNEVLSCILNINAFTEFGKAKFQIQEIVRKNRSKKQGSIFQQIIYGKSILNNIKKIEKCFEIRHATVHDTGTRYRLSKIETLLIENAVWQFNTFFELFIFKHIKTSPTQ